jgi:hypothetical protein
MKLKALRVVTFAMCCGAAPMLAQGGVRRFSLDVNAGIGYGSGGNEETDRTGVVTELFAAWRLSRDARASGIVGVDVSRQWQFTGDGCIPGRNGSCVPSYPVFNAVSLVAGGEWSSSRRDAVRLMGGPGDIVGTDRHGQRVSHALGLVGRFEGSLPFVAQSAFVISGGYAAVPNFHGHFYGPMAFTIGLRLN